MSLLKNPVNRVWLVLVVATLVTWWLGEGGWASTGGGTGCFTASGTAF